MIDDSFSIERDVVIALHKNGIYAVPGHCDDASLVAEIVRQHDLYQAMTLMLEESSMTKAERIAQLERERSILASRCYEQAQTIEKMLASRAEPAPATAEAAPVVAAIEAMQRNGVR